MGISTEILTELLVHAKQEELGLAIECHNPTYLYQMLTDANTDRDLIIARPSLPNHVFIVKRTVELYDDIRANNV